ncbi:vigilin [Nephila pilipes]|uniref:Vigilin n=1 Tax=Nephila pilipes TaxID=299642 RepID=A0A8X6R2U2_NEPPI|nr:vigilin [Nephila pilipes]
MKLTNFNVEVSIYNQNHKFIIRKDEANIKKIRDETNTKIDLLTEGAESDVIIICEPKDIMKAKKRLLEISNEKQLVGRIAEIKSNQEHKFFIGRSGARSKKVLDKTEAIIVFLNENDNDLNTILYIIGRKEEVEAATNEPNSLMAQLKDTAKAATKNDPKHHRYFVTRGAETNF